MLSKTPPAFRRRRRQFLAPLSKGAAHKLLRQFMGGGFSGKSLRIRIGFWRIRTACCESLRPRCRSVTSLEQGRLWVRCLPRLSPLNTRRLPRGFAPRNDSDGRGLGADSHWCVDFDRLYCGTVMTVPYGFPTQKILNSQFYFPEVFPCTLSPLAPRALP